MAMETLQKPTAVDEQVLKVVLLQTKKNSNIFFHENLKIIFLHKNNLVDQEKSNLHSLPTVDFKEKLFRSVFYAFSSCGLKVE